jgi:anti-sigma factor RsiW
MRCEDCRDLLAADADGELLPEESSAIRDHLASCVSCATEQGALRELSRRLKGGLIARPAPDLLEARIRGALARDDPYSPARSAVRPRWTSMAAAGVMIAALSATATFAVARRGGSDSSMSEQVLSSHIRSLMPGHLTDVASNDQHNVKPWFNGRVDLSPTVPRLDSAGFPLVGGRLDYIGRRPVPVIVYTRRQHVINVFSSPADSRTPSDATITTEHGYHLAHWSDGAFDFWATSDVAEPDLRRFVALFTKPTGEGASR